MKKIISYLVFNILSIIVALYISNMNNSKVFLISELNYKLFNFKVITLIYILVVVIPLMFEFVKTIKKPLTAKINELKEEINKKDYLLSEKAGSLLDKYLNLHRYREKEILLNNLETFTKNNQILHSTQIYRFNKKTYSDNTIIKIEYVNGYASEGIDINAMIQTYYNISNNIYYELMDILETSKKLDIFDKSTDINTLKSNLEMEEKIKTELENKIVQFVSKNIKDLKIKSDFNEFDSILLSLIELSIEILLGQEDDGNWLLNLLGSPKNKDLKKLKRTGILNGILKVEEHIFKNEGNNSKKGRIYITRAFKINNQEYIMILSVLPNIIDIPNWENVVKGLCTELLTNLQKDFEICYN